jgi:hypothetical protein
MGKALSFSDYQLTTNKLSTGFAHFKLLINPEEIPISAKRVDGIEAGRDGCFTLEAGENFLSES